MNRPSPYSERSAAATSSSDTPASTRHLKAGTSNISEPSRFTTRSSRCETLTSRSSNSGLSRRCYDTMGTRSSRSHRVRPVASSAPDTATPRFHARDFVRWAGKNKRLPLTLDFLRRQPRTDLTMDEALRQELIRRCVGDDSIALECDDFSVDVETHTISINLNDPPTPVPEPFGPCWSPTGTSGPTCTSAP